MPSKNGREAERSPKEAREKHDSASTFPGSPARGSRLAPPMPPVWRQRGSCTFGPGVASKNGLAYTLVALDPARSESLLGG